MDEAWVTLVGEAGAAWQEKEEELVRKVEEKEEVEMVMILTAREALSLIGQSRRHGPDRGGCRRSGVT